jgi:dihydroorotate dehydrogenase (fumarate)
MVDKLMANGAAAVTMFNRFYEPDINLDKLELSASEIFSSPADIRRTLRWVGLVSAALPKIEIAASTGIHDGRAVAKQLLAGAQVTQLCSIIYIEGLQVINGILQELEDFMDKWNFETIDAFRGRLSYAKIEDPMLYERSQFMKYFSSKN